MKMKLNQTFENTALFIEILNLLKDYKAFGLGNNLKIELHGKLHCFRTPNISTD